MEIPSTLPTFDELLGRPEFPDDHIVAHYLSLLRPDQPNVLTIHAEIEGMGKREMFRTLVRACAGSGVQFIRLDDLARELLADRTAIPVRDQVQASAPPKASSVAAIS